MEFHFILEKVYFCALKKMANIKLKRERKIERESKNSPPSNQSFLKFKGVQLKYPNRSTILDGYTSTKAELELMDSIMSNLFVCVRSSKLNLSCKYETQILCGFIVFVSP